MPIPNDVNTERKSKSTRNTVVHVRVGDREMELLSILKDMYRAPSVTHTLRLMIEDVARMKGILTGNDREQLYRNT